MKAFLSALPILLAVSALIAVAVQSSHLSDVEGSLDALSKRGAALAYPMPPEPPPPPPPEAAMDGSTDEELAAAPAPDDAEMVDDIRRLQLRLNAVERRVSLAMTVLDGLAGRALADEAATVAELAAAVETLRADVDALQGEGTDEAEGDEEPQDAADEAVAQGGTGAATPTERARTLADRRRALRDAHDRTWIGEVAQSARLSSDQAERLDRAVGDFRSRQEATFDAVLRGDKSLVDAQVELDELARRMDRQVEGMMSLTQQKAWRRQALTFPTARPGR